MPYAYQPYGPGASYALPNLNFASAGQGFRPMLEAYQTAYRKAQEVNAQRYSDILAGYRDLYAEQQGQLTGYGEQEKKDIATRFAGIRGGEQQRLIGAGLGASTILPGVMGGIGRQESDAQGRWADQLARMNLDMGARNAGNVLSFMERREDKFPDIGQLAQLASAYGAAGGGATPYRTTLQVNRTPISYGLGLGNWGIQRNWMQGYRQPQHFIG